MSKRGGDHLPAWWWHPREPLDHLTVALFHPHYAKTATGNHYRIWADRERGTMLDLAFLALYRDGKIGYTGPLQIWGHAVRERTVENDNVTISLRMDVVDPIRALTVLQALVPGTPDPPNGNTHPRTKRAWLRELFTQYLTRAALVQMADR